MALPTFQWETARLQARPQGEELESRPGQAAGFDDARFVNLLPQVSVSVISGWEHGRTEPDIRQIEAYLKACVQKSKIE